MTKDDILNTYNQRINELEALRTEYNGTVITLRTALAQKEEEVQILKEKINEHLFENTEENRELQELYIAKKRLPK